VELHYATADFLTMVAELTSKNDCGSLETLWQAVGR